MSFADMMLSSKVLYSMDFKMKMKKKKMKNKSFW